MGKLLSKEQYIRFEINYDTDWYDTLLIGLDRRGVTSLENAKARNVRVKDKDKRLLDFDFLKKADECRQLDRGRFPLRVKIPQQKVQLMLEISLKNLGQPEWRAFDNTRFVSSELKPYVQATYKNCVLKTNPKAVVEGKVHFSSEDSLTFDVPDFEEDEDDDEEVESDLMSKTTTSRGDRITVEVRDKRGFQAALRGDPLFGMASFCPYPGDMFACPTPGRRSLRQKSEEEEQTLQLTRQGKAGSFGEMTVKCTVIRVQAAKAVLAESVKHSLLTVGDALLQLLQMRGGINFLLSASPDGVTAVSEAAVREELVMLRNRMSEEAQASFKGAKRAYVRRLDADPEDVLSAFPPNSGWEVYEGEGAFKVPKPSALPIVDIQAAPSEKVVFERTRSRPERLEVTGAGVDDINGVYVRPSRSGSTLWGDGGYESFESIGGGRYVITYYPESTPFGPAWYFQILEDPATDDMWFGRLNDIARHFLKFVEAHSSPDADVAELIVSWMVNLHRKFGRLGGTSIQLMNVQRLKNFLDAAKLSLEDLEPVDDDGNVDPFWRQVMSSLKQSDNWHFALDQVPENAILGSGAFGTVWRGRDSGTRRVYAVKNVKVPRRGFADVGQRESEVAARLCDDQSHSCVVKLFNVRHFQDLRLYCFVMEYCPGGNMKSRIRKQRYACRDAGRPYVVPAQALHWAGQILLGMEYLHLRMDMLVRDLKTENVVLTEKGYAKITDFGLCRFGKQATGDWTFGAPPGSPAYIAPEVVKGESYGESADLYSFGVLVWVLLTGGLTKERRSPGGPLVDSYEPLPPCGNMSHGWDYSALRENCKLLAACMEDPEANHARPMPNTDEKDLVSALTHESAAERLSLEEVRCHPALEHLRLPDKEATTKEVEEWLAQMPQEEQVLQEVQSESERSGPVDLSDWVGQTLEAPASASKAAPDQAAPALRRTDRCDLDAADVQEASSTSAAAAPAESMPSATASAGCISGQQLPSVSARAPDASAKDDASPAMVGHTLSTLSGRTLT